MDDGTKNQIERLLFSIVFAKYYYCEFRKSYSNWILISNIVSAILAVAGACCVVFTFTSIPKWIAVSVVVLTQGWAALGPYTSLKDKYFAHSQAIDSLDYLREDVEYLYFLFLDEKIKKKDALVKKQEYADSLTKIKNRIDSKWSIRESKKKDSISMKNTKAYFNNCYNLDIRSE